MDISEVSKKLLKNAARRKQIETPDQTAERIDGALEKRNKAMNKIEEYQKTAGMPSKEEAVDSFLKEETGLGLSIEELNKFVVEE